jgi:hypothetical protein
MLAGHLAEVVLQWEVAAPEGTRVLGRSPEPGALDEAGEHLERQPSGAWAEVLQQRVLQFSRMALGSARALTLELLQSQPEALL